MAGRMKNELMVGDGPQNVVPRSHGAVARPGGHEDLVDLGQFTSTLWRRKLIIGICLLLGLIGGVALLKSLPPQYYAEAVLRADSRRVDFTDFRTVMSGMPGNAAAIRSEIDVIQSRAVVGNVVDQLNLTNDPEFNAQLQEKNGLWAGFVNWMRSLLPVTNPPQTEGSTRTAVINTVIDRLKAYNDGESQTIRVGMTSEDAAKSARIANAVVETYLGSSRDARMAAAGEATTWLAQTVEDLRGQVREADAKLEAFRSQNNLIQSQGETALMSQLAQINTALVQARAERLQAEAQLKAAQQAQSGRGSQVLSSPVVQSLREQESAINREIAEMSSRLGPKHPTIIDLNAQRQEVQRDIANEIARIVAGFRNAAEVALAREASLEDAREQIRGQVGSQSQEMAQLEQLQSEADATRSMFETMLNRYTELAAQRNVITPDVTVVSEADAPLRPTGPSTPLILGASLAVAAFIGMVLAVVADQFDRTFRSARSVEASLGRPVLGMVPKLQRKNAGDIMSYVLSHPTSRYVHALREVRHLIQTSAARGGSNVLVVTSAMPNEGKSTFSAAFGTLLAQGSRRVLLIECDLRRGSLAEAFKTKTGPGLPDLLEGRVTLEEVVQRDERSGLDYIISNGTVTDPELLLDSQAMRELIATAARHYDFVLLDAAPVGVAPDAEILAAGFRQCLFLVRWGKTPRAAVSDGLRRLARVNSQIAGIVMSRVDLKRHQKYVESSYDPFVGQYSSYFRD